MNRYLMIFSFVLLAILILAFSFDQKPKQYEYNEQYQTIFIADSNDYYTATFTTKGVTYQVDVNQNGIVDIHFLPKGKYIMRIYGANEKFIRARINKTIAPEWAF
ncbi:hypothetical protein [Croceivirga sp. JEA036]|uniref:hypothetical protein n=1 Tax=Croceivirga sp. JEA036 TaxID=2721162 RepID=UPI00143AF6D4|nr:hypothetical protein [Croceivirga sp. JEA036]NJB38105.1 hypothetical protein [Croceivirga sp. JEA036]